MSVDNPITFTNKRKLGTNEKVLRGIRFNLGGFKCAQHDTAAKLTFPSVARTVHLSTGPQILPTGQILLKI